MASYYHFEIIDSTSSYLKRNYKKYENMTFVSTDCQENGHGRNNRIWYSSAKKDLLFSILIKEKKLIEKYADLSLCSAVIILESLKELNIENVKIKWPNDVFVNNKKICGILLESISINNNIETLVIGIGLNVNSQEFNKEMINEPTSIINEINKVMDINELKEKIYSKFIIMFEKIKLGNRNYLSVVNENNYLKNKEVYININDEKVKVKVLKINEDNSLKVLLNEKEVNVYSGEVTFNL